MNLQYAIPAPINRALMLQPATEDARLWLDGTPLKIGKKDTTTKDGLWRLLSATMAILNQTHAELARAKAHAEEQAQKIALLERMSTTDDMTGLKNRRGFSEAFDQELDRVNRGLSTGGTLVVIDLDNFKGINDTYGHLAGDAALRLVGRTLANEIRTMDTAARLGGDEFVLIFADSAKNETLARIQNLAWRLNSLSLVWHGTEIPVRASVGVKSYSKGDNADDIFGAADMSLYEQKEARHSA